MIHLPGEPPRRAYADESFLEDPSRGYYVLAAAVFEPAVYGEVRDAMRGLRGRRDTKKLHWNEMDRAQQQQAAKRVGAFGGLHVVTIGSPLPLKRQERARAVCLRTLVIELHGLGVEELFIESRTDVLNARDVQTVRGARYALPRGTRFHVDHMPGAAEPLFWAADIVAGSVRTHRQGDAACRQLLIDCIYEIDVPTEC